MMTRAASFAATLLITLAALAPSPAIARPTDAQIAPVKQQLSKKIKVQFLETPLRRVIETLQRESGVTFVIDKEGIVGLDDKPVSLEAEAMTIDAALDWACRVTGTDWEVTGGVIVVSSARSVALRSLVTRTYDIRGLLISTPDFTAPSFDINSALSNTNSGGSAGQGVAMASTSLFASSDTEPQMSRQDLVSYISDLIMDAVGKPDEWMARGGDISNITELRGRLIVKSTPQNHEQISKLLDDLNSSQAQLVSIQARYVVLKSEALEKLLAANNGSLVLDEKQVTTLLAELAKPEYAAKRIGGSRTTCFSGQRVYVATGPVSTFVSDVEPIPSTAGVDPTLSVLRGGNVIDVEPTISYKGDAINVTFGSDIAIDSSIASTSIPTGGGDDGVRVESTGRLNGSTSPAKPDAASSLTGDVNSKGRLVVGKAGAPGSVELEKPAQDLVLFRSSITIPDGGAVIFTGSSNLLKASQKDDTEVVLILRATIRAGKK